MRRSMLFTTLLSGLLAASSPMLAGPLAGPLARPAPTTPAATPAPSGTTTQPSGTTTQPASSPRSANELLTLSAAALARANTYQYSGPASVATVSKRSTSAKLEAAGAFQKPSQSYGRIATPSRTGGSATTVETYFDGTSVYVRVTGGKNTASSGSWVKGSQTIQGVPNPFATLQVASQTVSTVTLGPNVTVNGKEYLTINAVLNQEAAKAMLGSIVSAAGYTPKTSGKGTIKAEATITYHIDPKTFLSEMARLAGSQTVSSSKGGTLTVKVDGQLMLSGVNQPVSLPDVSGASSAPTRQQ